MPRDAQALIFVGIKGGVMALDRRSGGEVWHAKLRGADFVTVLWDGEVLVAASGGEIFCLDPLNGAVVWHNALKGHGRGLVSLASSRAPQTGTTAPVVAKKRQDEAAAAAAAAG